MRTGVDLLEEHDVWERLGKDRFAKVRVQLPRGELTGISPMRASIASTSVTKANASVADTAAYRSTAASYSVRASGW
jgi:hypothetical protein